MRTVDFQRLNLPVKSDRVMYLQEVSCRSRPKERKTFFYMLLQDSKRRTFRSVSNRGMRRNGKCRLVRDLPTVLAKECVFTER